MACSGLARYAKGIGARRIKLPLPALRGSVEPANGSPVTDGPASNAAKLLINDLSPERTNKMKKIMMMIAVALSLGAMAPAARADDDDDDVDQLQDRIDQL